MQTHFLLALTAEVISNVSVSVSIRNNEAEAECHHCLPRLSYVIPRIVVWRRKSHETIIQLMTVPHPPSFDT